MLLLRIEYQKFVSDPIIFNIDENIPHPVFLHDKLFYLMPIYNILCAIKKLLVFKF